MSASQTPPRDGTAGSPPAADPSMEDILASIRRILNEDEPSTAEAAPDERDAPEPERPKSDVLALSEDMLVDDTPSAHAAAANSIDFDDLPPAPSAAMPMMSSYVAPGIPANAPHVAAPVEAPSPTTADPRAHLVADDAAAAAASSVGMLLRTLMNDREQVHVHRGGPTIEDMVREEVRSLLKVWLDANLPPMVERLVRSEIERVVGRATS
jgi:cell pole-organizing protein PopZ